MSAVAEQRLNWQQRVQLGRIKWYDGTLGYGFLVRDDGGASLRDCVEPIARDWGSGKIRCR